MPGGTFKKVVIDGITLSVKDDSDATLIGGNYDNAPIVHSGGAEEQKTRRAMGLTGLTVTLTASKNEQLNEVQARVSKLGYPLSFVTVAGDTYRTTGFINFQGMTTAQNTGTLDMFSKKLGGFVLFEA